MAFALLVACDSEQQANAETKAIDAPSTVTEKTSNQKTSSSNSYASIAGKYVDPKKPDSYLVLNANGSYLMTNNRRLVNGGKPFTGEFSLAGDQITLQLNEKQSSKLRFDNGTVVDRTGLRWEKQ